MADQTIPTTLSQEEPSAENVEGVSAEDYMAHYAEHGYEWVQGVAIKMSPVTLEHEELYDYLKQLLEAYFALNPTGIVVGDRFVMKIESVGSEREPDLMVILKSNPGDLTRTAMIGPADICIEVVSEGSEDTDFGKKFREYEKGGVNEYWIIDPLRKESRFHCLQPTKLYASVSPDADGHYRTPLLPRFALHVPTLWQEKLPDIIQVVQSAQAMLKE